MRLAQEERDLARAVERGEFKSVPDVDDAIVRYKAAARTTVQKDQRINIRLSARDLRQIQQRAEAAGLPYKTFIASVLHQYVNGTLR